MVLAKWKLLLCEMKATWNSSLAELIVAQVSCGLSTEFYSFYFVCTERLLAKKRCNGRGGDTASIFSIILCCFLFGALESSLMNYCLKNLCFCHRVSIIFLALHVYNLPLKFSSELPAIKTHIQPQLRLTGRLMTPDIKSGLPSGPCWGRMITYPMSFHKCEVGYYMLQINTVTGRKCSLTRKRFSDN